MANASRDENDVPTLLGALETDGRTTIPIKADPVVHSLDVDDSSGGSDHGPSVDIRDQNYVPALMAVSREDGVTPVVVYATADGKLLVDSMI